MLKKPTKKREFSYKKEQGQNPFTGFMSFQHFRDEALYSDLAVLPERNYTETEHFECYPIPDYVPEKGRDEGYYPENSIVYIRSLWKEFEPERGRYNYAFIEDILDKAKRHNQTLTFRLMAHSTREAEDVPHWLKELIPCPLRPEGKRVKDSPTDPLFLELFTEAVRKIGERFDGNPYFEAMDISLPGAWGEGHNLHLYSDEALEKLFDAYTDSFKKTRLIAQMSRPELIMRAISKGRFVGARGDGFGHPGITFEHYPARLEKLGDLWKKAPISLESYWWLPEWQRQGWDIDKLIETTLSWHISSFNGKSIPAPFEWKDKIDAWVSKMGYHFAFSYFSYSEEAFAGDCVLFDLGIENVGVAPIYNSLPLKVYLKGEEAEYEFLTDIDITKWLPGKASEEIKIALPENIKEGRYAIEIGIGNEIIPMVYFCTDAEFDNGRYVVGELNIKNRKC